MGKGEPTVEYWLNAPRDDLKPADTMGLARRIRAGEGPPGLSPLRVACLSTFSLDFVDPYLVVEAARTGLDTTTYYGAFGQFEQELIDGASALYEFGPDALVLAMRPEDIEPDAVVRFYAADGRRFAALSESLLTRIGNCIELFRAHSAAPVLVANFATPAQLPLRVFDANVSTSITHALAETNRQLVDTLASHTGALVWDYAGLVRDRGAGDWSDRRLFALARAPVAAKHQPALARHLVRTLGSLLRPPAKCLVLDLDDTLWGGVIGDDGLAGIQLGDDHPGVVYRSFQRAVLGLRDRGVLLAVASKNDRDVARAAFEEHPEMLIRWEDLAATRINWESKSANLREIAAELNIGADSLVLFDDNRVERAEVRANAPEVRVIEVPSSPLGYEQALDECFDFDMVSLTKEDSMRAEAYRQENQRSTLRESAASLEKFLESLQMKVTTGRLGASSLQRVAQLVAKTNQFNLTTRRHSRTEIQAMGEDPDQAVVWLRLADRYGDSGLVGVGIVRRSGDEAILDTLLMSCRVMGRGVERALLAQLSTEARGWGCARIVGDYLPSPKNSVVRELYPEMGFGKHAALDSGGTRYALDLTTSSIDCPSWIERVIESDCAEPSGSAR